MGQGGVSPMPKGSMVDTLPVCLPPLLTSLVRAWSPVDRSVTILLCMWPIPLYPLSIYKQGKAAGLAQPNSPLIRAAAAELDVAGEIHAQAMRAVNLISGLPIRRASSHAAQPTCPCLVCFVPSSVH